MESLERLVTIPAGSADLEGMLHVPAQPLGVVVFAHGSGSSRFSPRNNHVAEALRALRIGTLLMDLLTTGEDQRYRTRFDIPLLTERLAAALDWLRKEGGQAALPLGLFGASTGAAAALQVAAQVPLAAVVSRGGRPDMAGAAALRQVHAPTLLIVGGEDRAVIELNKAAYDVLHCEKRLAIVAGATHLFEEPGALDEVAEMAGNWFLDHFTGRHRGHGK